MNSLLTSPNFNPEDEENVLKQHTVLLNVLQEMSENNKQMFPVTVSNTNSDAKVAIEPATANKLTLESSKIDKGDGDYH
jgi:hypothetical protein